MPAANWCLSLKLVIGLCGLVCFSSAAAAQTPQNPKPEDNDDVLRIYSDLVQTDVMVFDKQGHFVNGLKREDFELRIDGKPQPVQFFERVTAGSANEEAQLSAARGLTPPPNGKELPPAVPLDRGRTIFFFVDDFHFAARDVLPTRKVLLNFIEKGMGQNDEVEIGSASGQIGFLQQLTDNKAVLRAAVDRLKARAYYVTDMERPPMTEYQALQIDRYDRDITDYFVEEVMRRFPGLTRDQAENQVRTRAHMILTQASNVTINALASLENLVRSSSKLPGRKLLFFFSGGFFLDERNSDPLERLRRITSAAARNGVVIYSLDARGLVASLVDASSDVAFDPSGRVERASSGELLASQDAMNALAKDTGGRTVFNTNDLSVGLSKALNETSVYYLLAWRPAHDAPAPGKFRRIAVSLPTHPELTVRVRQGFYSSEPAKTAKRPKEEETVKAAKPAPDLLFDSLRALYPNGDLPVSLNLNYLNTPDKGMLLTASTLISTETLSFTSNQGKQNAVIDIGGSIYNDQGKAGGGFSDHLTIATPSLDRLQGGRDLLYNYQIYLTSGLYQVRVGVRDLATGRIGTVHQWIEIPNLASHQLALSSLIAGERLPQAESSSAKEASDPSGMGPLRVGRRFHRNSFLRFLVYVYNAARASTDARPDVALQVQVLRDQQPVITTPLKRISTDGIQLLDQLPYAADVSLEGLAAGRYILQVTTIDRVSKTSASQAMHFEIE